MQKYLDLLAAGSQSIWKWEWNIGIDLICVRRFALISIDLILIEASVVTSDQ